MTTTTSRESSSPAPTQWWAPGPSATTVLDKVTGRAKFRADINLPGMLHGKVLRSPHAHARIPLH